jgi:hypothetical protein
LILAGFLLLSASWRVLYNAQREGRLATTGPYAYIRHPQYVGFIVIMFGFLLQWPTVITLAMFPIMATVYVRLAHREKPRFELSSGQRGTSTRQGRRDLFPGYNVHMARCPAHCAAYIFRGGALCFR